MSLNNVINFILFKVEIGSQSYDEYYQLLYTFYIVDNKIN